MRWCASIAVIAVLALAQGCIKQQEKPQPAVFPVASGSVEVTDISGKKYFPAVHAAFQRAEKSIRVAMFRVKIYPGKEKYLANILVQDLVDARKRGVDVVVHLDDTDDNTEDGGSGKNEKNTVVYETLRSAGVDARLMNHGRKLHAKLIVIDNKVVIDGSANWSFSALSRNAESTSLIISERYGAEKAAWIDSL